MRPLHGITVVAVDAPLGPLAYLSSPPIAGRRFPARTALPF
jgi:hypothetical protein